MQTVFLKEILTSELPRYTPCIMSVQYTGGCSVYWREPWVQWGIPLVHQGVFSTLWGYHEYTRGLPWWMWEISWVHWGMFSTLGDTMSKLGDTKMHVGVIMRTLGSVQYAKGIPWVHQWLDSITDDKLIPLSFTITAFLSISWKGNCC